MHCSSPLLFSVLWLKICFNAQERRFYRLKVDSRFGHPKQLKWSWLTHPCNVGKNTKTRQWWLWGVGPIVYKRNYIAGRWGQAHTTHWAHYHKRNKRTRLNHICPEKSFLKWYERPTKASRVELSTIKVPLGCYKKSRGSNNRCHKIKSNWYMISVYCYKITDNAIGVQKVQQDQVERWKKVRIGENFPPNPRNHEIISKGRVSSSFSSPFMKKK